MEADLAIVDTDTENLYIYDFARENSIDLWLGILENVSKIFVTIQFKIVSQKTISDELDFDFFWVDGTKVGGEESYANWFIAEGEQQPT